ncbi:Crp/Fnr family transcriptional regulator [Flavobacterium sp. ANB]|uniref:Crp/Fnr family transcriptional regulator n=1 Tax=unclassified Flavobacterium TaxID=196869 RepID=UPI0012B9B308|nr:MULTISPECIES: Crp/Fnr family transcriptional regulator [unclassified Flavobacterium]MBF4515625.1 Crp/Fnr family transcriptional regulator [Flavobacterium sp. ANB]MTD68628.1 cyclic nucleotide-binding domain-containing protein [Flavobacterium sp. LC2016-13]
MYGLFFQNIAKHIQLNSAEELQLKSKLHFKNVAKNEPLLKIGEHCRTIYFVDKGCLRIYQNHENGDETNILFCPENWWACDIMSFSLGTPATYAIEALEDGEVIGIDLKDLEELYMEIPKLERFFRILFQNGFALYQNRLTLALSTSAEIRYTLFNKQYPMLINRISQKHIASYLGITPVFLSIIRKRKL